MLNTVIKGCHTIEEFKTVRDRMEQLTAEIFQHHKRAVSDWPHGEPVKAWYDSKNNICVEYADGVYNKAINNQKAIGKLQKDMERLLELAESGEESVQVVHKRLENLQTKIEELELDEFMDSKTIDRMRIAESLPFTL